MRYVKQLDSLRAIAALLVITTHWFDEDDLLFQIFKGRNGAVAVDFFFVLSGFLITSTLLRAKKQTVGNIAATKNFYVRRMLRIFPIYFLTLLLLFFFGHLVNLNIQPEAFYYFSYSTNFLLYKIQSWGISAPHLWSLAVEEQFYLLWPWIVLFINRRYLLSVILLFITLGVTSNYLFPEILPFSGFIRVLSLACFDAFGLGALLAYVLTKKEEQVHIFSRLLVPLGILASFLFVGVVYLNMPEFIPLRTLTAVLSVSLLFYALEERKDYFYTYLLSNRLLVWMGKLSYGMYLYHAFIPSIWGRESKILKLLLFANEQTSPFVPENSWVVKTEYFIFLMLVSWVSWRLVEQPFNRFKKHFDYKLRMVKEPDLIGV